MARELKLSEVTRLGAPDVKRYRDLGPPWGHLPFHDSTRRRTPKVRPVAGGFAAWGTGGPVSSLRALGMSSRSSRIIGP